MEGRVYLFPDLKKIGIPWTRQYISRLEKAGRFPRRFRLGDRQVAGRPKRSTSGSPAAWPSAKRAA